MRARAGRPVDQAHGAQQVLGALGVVQDHHLARLRVGSFADVRTIARVPNHVHDVLKYISW